VARLLPRVRRVAIFLGLWDLLLGVADRCCVLTRLVGTIQLPGQILILVVLPQSEHLATRRDEHFITIVLSVALQETTG
jgi:hypothetical protein